MYECISTILHLYLAPSDVVTIGLNTNFSNPDPNNNGCNNLDSTILNVNGDYCKKIEF